MFRSYFFKLVIRICLVCVCTAASLPVLAKAPAIEDAAASGQIQFAPILVNGRALTGPNSAAHRRDGRILIPVLAVARALGDAVSVDVVMRTVTIRRQTGLAAELDGRNGQVRESGSLILTVSNAGEITFTPNIDELLLPVEIASSLFDVAVSYDPNKDAVIITRGQARTENAQGKSGRSAAELYQVDYEYNLSRYSSGSSHNLVLRAAGRLADGRFNFVSNSTSLPSHGISVRNSTFSLERPNGQRYVAGDLGTGTALQFLSANVRGGSASIPIGHSIVTAFAGRSFSGAIIPVIDPNKRHQGGVSYDTNIFGVFATTNSTSNGRKAGPFNFAAGAMRFSSYHRSGELATGSVNYDISRFRVQSDVAYGRFDSIGLDNVRQGGNSAAIDIAATFQLTSELALQARYTNIGKNFLSPQSGFREPLDLKSMGISWSPVKWFSASFNTSTARRPGDKTQNNKFVTAAFALTPGARLPRFYFAHTQSSTSQIRSAAFSMLNASKEFRRLRLFMNATRIKNLGPATMNAQFGANYALSDANSLEFSQGVGSRGSLNGQVDWRTSTLLNHRLTFSVGAGYNYNRTSGVSTFERLSASVNLPRQTSLQVNYYQTNAGPTVLVSFKGSLFKKREARAFLDSSVAEMNSYGKVSGRVYQDVDQNGRFDAGVDRPQADVKIRVDGNRYVVSDANGHYRFESVPAGDHKVYLDLLSVRADLTLLGVPVQDAKLLPGSNSVYDFRLVRTGRISGRVWLDTNENGKFDKGETTLADIRVVTASGRDTLTDAEGNFTIGDLPPGEHVFFLDETTLPEKTMAGFKPLAIHAFPGRETNEIALAVIMIPAEVKRFPARPNK